MRAPIEKAARQGKPAAPLAHSLFAGRAGQCDSRFRKSSMVLFARLLPRLAAAMM